MHIRIGTRKSPLALTQSEMIGKRLQQAGCTVEYVKIETSGDLFMGDLTAVGGKGLFVKEIEEALLAKAIDLAIHSLKDLPAELPTGLCLAATPLAEDPRDVLILAQGSSLADLRAGAVVGTSSLRRQLQLKALRSDLSFVPLRGNVDTRLRKLSDGVCEATILAAAGLNRLQKKISTAQLISVEDMVPAVGQGVLALETRSNHVELRNLLEKNLHDAATALRVVFERSFLLACGGDCKTPIAAHAVLHDERLSCTVFLANPKTGYSVKLQENCTATAPAANELGKKMAQHILAQVKR